MAGNKQGLLHLHRRKRVQKKLEPYPHPNPYKRFLDNAMLVVAVIVPFMTIPQVAKIWVNQSAHDLSLVTWVAYFISASMWLMYSLVHKDRALIANSTLWVFLYLVVIAGILVYG